MHYTVELTHDPAEIGRLRGQWTALHEGSANDSIYMTWEWISLWWAYHGDQHQLWLLKAYTPDGRLVGLAPLMLAGNPVIKGYTRHLTRFRELQFIGEMSGSDHLDFIVERGHERGVIPAFLSFLKDKNAAWDILHLSGLSSRSSNLDILRKSHLFWHETTAYVCPVVSLPNDWEILFQGLSPAKRRELRRSGAQLDKCYPNQWDARVITNAVELDTALDRLFELHQAKWNSHGALGAFGDHRAMAFHRAVAHRLLELGWLRFYRLDVEKEIGALLYCYQFRDRVYAYASGINPRLSREMNHVSPGHALIELAMREAIANQAHEFDFLRGDEAYKFRWGAEARMDLNLRWVMSFGAQFEQATLSLTRNLWHGVKCMIPKPWRHALTRVVKKQYQSS
jgi:hypothetical protein